MKVFDGVVVSPRPLLMRLLWPFLKTHVGIDCGLSHVTVAKAKKWRGVLWIYETSRTTTEQGEYPPFMPTWF